MKKFLAVMLVCSLLFALSCGSSDKKDGKMSLIEKKIEMIKTDNPGKPVKQMVEILKLKGEDESAVKKAVMEIYSEITGKVAPHQLAQFKESPNRNIQVPGNVSRIHIKSDYVSSANVMLFLMKGKEPVVWDELEFNTEKKYDFAPGNYDFIMIVDRPDNSNVYVFKYDRSFKGGELYLGEFKIVGKYSNSGECAKGYLRDDAETCIAPSFKIFDNCDAGTHLVEHLCCEEGFNFIMEGQCSRYSDTVENVICPAGYHEGGKGRCCPIGQLFIDNKCQVPPKEEPAK